MMTELSAHRVLVLHNRYRTVGGEERCVEHLLDLISAHGGEVCLLGRDSARTSAVRAASGMLRGGLDPDQVAAAVRDFGATVVHAHNIHPTLGYRALEAARAAGAAVVLHLHNYRLYCAIGTSYRDGADCTLCAPDHTFQGVRHRCRGSLPEALTYAWGIGRGQRRILSAIDRMIAPAQQLAKDLEVELGRELPLTVAPHWLPDSEFAHCSRADNGEYALLAGRISSEKGIFTAIEAAAISEVPLMLAGIGPDLEKARSYSSRIGAPVEFAGHLDGQALVAARMGAAMALMPSLWREVWGFSGLEALAAGLPLITSDRGALPDQTESELVTGAGDAKGLAERMARLMADAELRRAAGERALQRARERFSERAAAPTFARIYDEAIEARNAAMRSPISSPASS